MFGKSQSFCRFVPSMIRRIILDEFPKEKKAFDILKEIRDFTF